MASNRKVRKLDGGVTGSGFVMTVEYDDGEVIEYKRSVNGTPLARSGGRGVFRPVDKDDMPQEVHDQIMGPWSYTSHLLHTCDPRTDNSLPDP